MNEKNLYKTLRPNIIINYIVMLCFAVISLKYDKKLFAAEISVAILVIILQKITAYNKRKKIEDFLHQLVHSSEALTKNFTEENPVPMAVINDSGDILWYNKEFAECFLPNKTVFSNIGEVIEFFPRIRFEANPSKLDFEIEYKNRVFKVRGTTEKTGEEKKLDIALLDFIDITETVRLKEAYFNDHVAFATVMIDNFDECINGISEANKAVLAAETDKHIFNWAQEANAVIIKIERNKYIILFENKNLDEYLKNGFNKLRILPEAEVKSKIPLTFSIGIGVMGESLSQNEAFSQAAIDMALGRGGDQIVVKNDKEFSFYGGFSKEIEKRTKVRARVVAGALKELIMSKDNIIVVGHKNPDMDLVGSALGINRACLTLGKKCHILLDNINPSIQDIADKIEKDYDELFINKYHADSLLADNGMLIIVDTHRKGLLPYPDMLNATDTVVMIDHHRKSPDFIPDTTLLYHEPYASSTCELVIEILQYFNEKIIMTPTECEAMYAGMLIDTTNFTYKTGVRTFEAASFLRREGLNTIEAKELVKCDLDTYAIRSKIINNATIYKGKIAISVYSDSQLEDLTIIAQAADELTNIKGITTTFVMYFDGTCCRISARSIGDINVQLIMEKMDGGGHQLSAGTLIKSKNPDEVKERLIKVIDEYLKTENV